MWWEWSEGVWSQVRPVTKTSTSPHLLAACDYSPLCVCVCVSADRYVIYGNHRDSWVHGAIDPSSGTSVMLELTRVLGRMVKQGEGCRGRMKHWTVCGHILNFLFPHFRHLEASQVHHLWKLGGRGVWPYRVCRIHRGDLWSTVDAFMNYEVSNGTLILSFFPPPAILHQAERANCCLHQCGYSCFW